MGILSIIVILFTLMQLTVALINLTGNRRLPATGLTTLSDVSILIPARNEAGNLPVLLNDLLQLPARPLEILICDDHSTDATFTLAAHIAAHHPHLRIFQSEMLPPGWQGKNFACYQLARQAKGRYLLFIDADVRISGTDIQRTLSLMQNLKTGLLSVFPCQIMLTDGEKNTVPLMTYILLTLLPLPFVYRITEQSALAAANGQYMLFEASAYRQLQPHRQVRHSAVEDIAISRYYKKQGQPVACLTGFAGISCRMYPSRTAAIRGFARNIAAFFGGSLGVAALFWLLTSWGWIPIALYLSWSGLIIYLFVRFTIRAIVSLTCRQPVAGNLFRAFAQQGNMLLILLQAWHTRRIGHQEWKGRNIL